MMSTTLQLSNAGRAVTYQQQGQGEPVVLLHGVGMQAAAWSPQIAALSSSYSVIALNLPGHGGSQCLEEGAPLESYVDWLDDVLEALAIKPVNLVGHSMGALIAGGYAARHPAAVLRVALLNGVYCRTDAARAAVIARADQIKAGEFDLETPLSRWFGDTPSEQAIKDDVAQWLSVVDGRGYATAYAAFARGDRTFAQELPKIAAPFLTLTGADDPNSTPEMAEQMANLVQRGKAVSVPGHRHMVNLTAADVVNAELLEWLKTDVTEGPAS